MNWNQKMIIFLVLCRLEVRSHQVKSVFQTATKLKMDRVAKECARHLIQHMDAESCIEIRSLPGIARNKTFVAQVDSYIAQQVSAQHGVRGLNGELRDFR